jgi:hypothetical protein
MNSKKKIVALISALILSLGLSAGAIAQESEATGSGTVSITVLCTTANAAPSTVSLVSSGNANFENLDPSDPAQLALRSTESKALRVVMDVDPCLTGAWHVDASITNFASGENTISGTKFRLPIGDNLSSTTAATVAGDVVVPGVVAPSTSFVTFAGASSPFAGSHAIAISSGTNTGEMYMDFTGQLTDLDAETPDGTYSATLTVTFSPGAP